MNASRLLLLGSTALACIAVQPVVAAQAGPAVEPDPTEQGTSPADASATEADVVVTGSRVIRNGNNSPTPVTVVSVDDALKANPSTVADALQTIPALLGSQGQTTNQGTSAGNLIGNTINLRGIGSTRALILFDGRRVAPTNVGSQVDIDVIPQILLKRVDLVTGGASAVYGSDAVSGVVNFITDAKFNGFKADLRAGVSGYKDGGRSYAGAAFGTPVGSRGHFEIGYEYSYDPGIANKFSRPWFRRVYTEQGSVPGGGAVGSATNPYKLTADTRLATTTFGGLVNSGPLAGLQFTQAGTLAPFVHGTLTGATGVESGGDGAYYTATSLATQRISNQVFSRFDYDVTDGIHAYVQVAGSQIHNRNNDRNAEVRPVAIGYNNAFLNTVQQPYQAQIAAALAANPLATFNFSKMFTDVPAYSVDSTTKQYMLLAGLDGKIGDFDWSFGYERSDSVQKTRNDHNINRGRLLAAINAVRLPSGQVVCNAALVNPTVYGGCVPLDLFGQNAASQAAIDYITQVTQYRAEFTMDDYLATISGAPFSTWAGPVNMAITGEYRNLGYELVSNAQPTDTVNCTGIQFNCNAGVTPYLSNVIANRSPVSQKVAELAYEADVPLLTGKRFFQAVNLNLAARYTHYNTSGSVGTWKAGVDWNISDELKFRGTRSRDIRAPTLNDLYSPPLYTPRSYVDPHTGITGSTVSISQGNPDLVPEIANTITAGVVLRPRFLPGFSLSVDAYRIRIKDAIAGIDAYNPTIGTLCEASNGASPLCALYVRPLPFSDRSAANFPTALLAQSLNIASFKTKGIDVEANYVTRLLGRNLALRGLFSYQPDLIYNSGPTTGPINAAGAGDTLPGLPPIPSRKAVATVNYDLTANLSILVQERWRASLKQNGTPNVYFVDGKVPSAAYTDVTVTFAAGRSALGSGQFFLNVRNLFDKAPDPFASTGGSGLPGIFGGFAQGDDIIGRYFTIGFRIRP